MRLSKKHTTIYVVVATWPNGKVSGLFRCSESAAANLKTDWRHVDPHAFVQIHTIDQALPEVPKP